MSRMNCIEHSLPLRPNGVGQLSCSSCQSLWLSSDQMEAFVPESSSLLSVETRPDAVVFKKKHKCPECFNILTPLRVSQSENWVERCNHCERFWLEKLAQRQLQNFVQTRKKEARFQQLPQKDREELQTLLAQSAKESMPRATLTPKQLLLSALGIPVLTGVPQDRFPLATVVLLIFVSLPFFLFAPQGMLQWAYLPGGSPTGLWTGQFAHLGLIHFLGNALFLLTFGNAVEQILKSRWVLSAFAVWGPLTFLMERMVSPSDSLILGASGAVSVLVGMSAALLPRARMLLHPFRFSQPIEFPLWLFVLGEILYNAAMFAVGVPGIAWVSHLSGLTLGFLIGKRLSPR